MKDIYQIFDDGLLRLSQVNEVSTEGCFRLARDLTRIATYSDFKQGVLIAEVLEGIFIQIGPLFERYNIPEDEGKDIKNTIGQYISSLSAAYKNNASEAYVLLADLRFAATQFQFKCYTTWRRIPIQSKMPFGVDA